MSAAVSAVERSIPFLSVQYPSRHYPALHYMHYNFCRIHKTLRVTPAMAAGVTDRLWSIGDMVAVLEAWEDRSHDSHS